MAGSPRIPRQRTGSVSSPGFGVWNKGGPGGRGPTGGGGGGSKNGCAIAALMLVSIPTALAAAGGYGIYNLFS